MAYTRDEIIAAAKEMAPDADVRDTLLQYAQANNIPLSQVDTLLELPAGSSEAYASRSAITQLPVEDIVAKAQELTPEGGNYQQTLLDYGTKAGLTPDQMDIVLGLPSGATAAYANRSALTQFTPDQIRAEAEKMTPEGGDVRDTLLQYIRDNNISFDQADILLGLPSGSAAAYAASKDAAVASGETPGYTDVIDNLTGATTRSMLTSTGVPIKQTLTPLTQASPGVVPTLRPQPVQGVDQTGMMSTGFQSPVPSSIADLFSSVQDVRNINQGYLSAPRTDLSGMRASMEAQYAAQDKADMDAAIEAQKKNLTTLFSGNNGSGDYSQLSPQVAAYLDSLSPEERDQRMREISQMLTPGFVTALNNQFGTYNSSYGTSTANSSLSNEAKAGLAAAQTSFGYGSDKNFYGD